MIPYDLANMNYYSLLPYLIIAALILFASKALKMPEEYYKSRQLREAMLKRRAEKADIERMEELRALQDLEEIEDEDE